MDTLDALYQRQHERQDELVRNAEYAVCVLGKGNEFVLVPVTEPEPIADVVEDAIKRRGLQFCGTLGVADGVAACVCEPNREALAVMTSAIMEFAKLHTARRKAKAEEWLIRLWQLEDVRP
jgi:hypothetical protein